MQEWDDPRLRHNYDTYLDGSNFVGDIWMPDTYFKESTITDRRNLRQFEDKKSLVRIHPGGKVYYSTR